MSEGAEAGAVYPTLLWGLGTLVLGPLGLAVILTLGQRVFGSTLTMLLGPLVAVGAFVPTILSARRVRTGPLEPNWSMRLGVVVGAVVTTIGVLVGFAIPFIRGG